MHGFQFCFVLALGKQNTKIKQDETKKPSHFNSIFYTFCEVPLDNDLYFLRVLQKGPLFPFEILKTCLRKKRKNYKINYNQFTFLQFFLSSQMFLLPQ